MDTPVRERPCTQQDLGGPPKILRSAGAAAVAEVYRQLGLTLTYNHETRQTLAEVQPAPMGVVRVSETDTTIGHMC